MEFRLLYEGPLRAEREDTYGSRGRAKDKQELRKCFHPQLRELWNMHPNLKALANNYYYREQKDSGGFHYTPVAGPASNSKKYIDWIADDQRIGKIRCFLLPPDPAPGVAVQLPIKYSM
jgi:hypothetical protein